MSNWSMKSDQWLIEVLQGEDLEEIFKVFEVVKRRYYGEINKIMYQTLGNRSSASDVTDYIVDSSLNDLLRAVRTKKVVNLGRYFLRIVHNMCVDELEAQIREQEIEKNLPVQSPGIEDSIVANLEDEEIREKFSEFKLHIATKARLSPCQRVIWLLKELYQYPPILSARFLAKDRGTIDTQYHGANKRIKKFFIQKGMPSLESFNFNSAYNQIVQQQAPFSDLFVERFAEMIAPQFTSEELAPLGLPISELQRHFNMSLVLPGVNSQHPLPFTYLIILLSERQQWVNWHQQMQLFAARKGLNEHEKMKWLLNLWELKPREYPIKVMIDNGNFALTEQNFLLKGSLKYSHSQYPPFTDGEVTNSCTPMQHFHFENSEFHIKLALYLPSAFGEENLITSFSKI